ncbi:hypothetical protein OS493_013584 [Desmophyllum pertusum]|uniref:Uncharacterized protein n=1 Tax=Desmophyllum pertusum TaxID=174260 RepID=A0A9X0A348_9CNID|nr:hypothetical protein OS493_013584 [Desmophyllum pertusum]
MPRAFLIKAKKEKKKDEGQISQSAHENGQFSNGVADPHSNVYLSRPEAQVSPPTDFQSSPPASARLHFKRKHSQSTAEDRLLTHASHPVCQADGFVTNKNTVTEIPRVANRGLPRKTRKKGPKKNVVYYYKVAQEGEHRNGKQPPGLGHDTSSNTDVPHEQGSHTHQRKSHNYAAANSKGVKSQGNPNGSYYYNPPTHSASCQEKSTRFKYEKASHPDSAKQFNYAAAAGNFPRERREVAPAVNNVGLDNVKIVEVHSIGQKMDIVYPEETRNGPVPAAPAHRPNEDYRCNVSAANNVPASAPPPQHYIPRKEPTPRRQHQCKPLHLLRHLLSIISQCTPFQVLLECSIRPSLEPPFLKRFQALPICFHQWVRMARPSPSLHTSNRPIPQHHNNHHHSHKRLPPCPLDHRCRGRHILSITCHNNSLRDLSCINQE